MTLAVPGATRFVALAQRAVIDMRGRIQPPVGSTASTGVAPRACMGQHVPRFTPTHLILLPYSGRREHDHRDDERRGGGERGLDCPP
jgi:hypothetical protein